MDDVDDIDLQKTLHQDTPQIRQETYAEMDQLSILEEEPEFA